MAVECAHRKLFGLQYHPEVMHSERGTATLRHFLFGIADIPADWKIENVLEEEMQKLRQTVRSRAASFGFRVPRCNHHILLGTSLCPKPQTGLIPAISAVCCGPQWVLNL